MKHIVKNIHFVGIGGIGMSGIAEIMLAQGYQISGSDKEVSVTTRRLVDKGAKIFYGHRPEHVHNADVIVVSSAIDKHNCEIVAAKFKKIPIVSRAAMLAELMRSKQGIAVAGTHGKTTTTSLIASILIAGGFDPTYVIGGHLISNGMNARLGDGEFIVAEADESDTSFLNLSPMIEVITNIDNDHMESYTQDMSCLKQTFVDFTHRLPFYGKAIVCVDDENINEIMSRVLRSTICYGFNESAKVRAIDVLANGLVMNFNVLRSNMSPLPIVLNLPGKHNVLNALAAIAVATELAVPNEIIQDVLLKFNGVRRRFQYIGDFVKDGGKYTVIDDYAHHPSEITAAIAATRGAYPNRRIIVCFQPHRYTRTRDCFEALVSALSQADLLFLSEVYAASEKVITTADGRSLAHAIKILGETELIFIENIENMGKMIHNFARANDVVLIMGAGSISKIVIEYLRHQNEC